jgi:hypothetical protein
VGRRSALKLVGAAALVPALAGSGAAAGDYETIRLSSGERRQIQIGSGETFENTLIDIGAEGADVQIVATGSDWTVRNVGIVGGADVSSSDGGYPNMLFASGNGLVENVYLGDGVAYDGVRKGAIGVPKSHSGRIEVRNCYIARWTGNALYAATAAESGGGGGSVAVRNSYFRDNTISHVRIAQDDSVLENCVITNTNNVPQHPWGTRFSRGLWSLYGDRSQVVDVRNCDIDITNQNSNGGGEAIVSVISEPMSQFRLLDSRVRGNMNSLTNIITENLGDTPNVEVPDGVPTSGEAAASGTSDTSDGEPAPDPDLPNTLTINGLGETTNYEFSVSGDLAEDADADGLETWDDLSGSTANGWVTDAEHADSFRFSGDVTEFTFHRGEAQILLNGSEVTPAEFEDLPNTLTINGLGETTNYEFSVSGDLAEDADADGLETWDDLSGSTANGWVTDAEHADSFRFSGDITEFTFHRGEAEVYRNGTDVTDELSGGSDEQQTRTLTINGLGETTNYEFSVSGDLSENADADGLETWDDLSGSTANGWVTDAEHADSFRFTGDITEFTFHRGEAEILIDGDRVAPEDI